MGQQMFKQAPCLSCTVTCQSDRHMLKSFQVEQAALNSAVTERKDKIRSRAVHRCTTGGAVLSHSSETCSAYSASCHLDGLTKLSPKPMCVFLLVCSRPVFEVLATCCTCCAVLHSKARTKITLEEFAGAAACAASCLLPP